MSIQAFADSVTLCPMSRPWIVTILAVLITASPVLAQETYIVQPGDTLVALAERYGTTVEAILAANSLTGTDLFAGATLVLPGAETYVVQPGDTLSDVALTTGVPVEELMALNGLSDTTLTIGQELVTGGAAPDAPLTLTVEAGDSLWSLSERYGVPVEQISSANGILPDAMLSVGDSLQIPGVRADAVPSDQGGGAEPSITIASGDSLSEIALRHGTSVEALMDLNGLESDVVNAGSTLLLPPASGADGTSIIWPLEGLITSYFGPRNLLGMTYHYGLDIDGDTGDPVVAAVSGVVTYSGWLGGYGYLTVVEADGVEYFYGHASELLTYVGQEIYAGDVIAKVGATGRATGSHLHFEIRMDGQAVDPLPYLERTASLP